MKPLILALYPGPIYSVSAEVPHDTCDDKYSSVCVSIMGTCTTIVLVVNEQRLFADFVQPQAWNWAVGQISTPLIPAFLACPEGTGISDVHCNSLLHPVPPSPVLHLESLVAGIFLSVVLYVSKRIPPTLRVMRFSPSMTGGNKRQQRAWGTWEGKAVVVVTLKKYLEYSLERARFFCWEKLFIEVDTGTSQVN